MTQEAQNANYIQAIFHALLVKLLPTWSEATKFAEENEININTMRAAYYTNGGVGITAMNDIIRKLLDLSPEKVASIIASIDTMEPVAESMKIFSQINASEKRKTRYANYAMAIAEIEKQLGDSD